MAQTMTICRGLPGSGKSTWARKQASKNTRRVNRDDVRLMLGVYDDFTPKRERMVSAITRRAVEVILRSGDNVIIDDCNLNPTYIAEWRKVAEEYEQIHGEKVAVVIQDFTDVPLRECLKRNAERHGAARANVRVVHEMYERWLKPAPPVFDPSLPHCVIADMDGTIAHMGNRSPFDASQCDVLDTPNRPVINVLGNYMSAARGAKTKLIIFSGREEKDREPTLRWLEKHAVGQDELWMRPTGDHRNDAIVKKELYEAHVAGKYNVDFCIDDRDRVVDLWRSMGLTCFQVAEGWF